jgi:signal transduction histidine kinase
VATDRDDELTRLGHTLNDLLSRLEASAVREHQFLADTSHELRTPLALLKAEIEFALNRPRTPDQLVSTLTSVRAQTDRLISLANALLELEEIDSGPDMTRVAVDVPALVETVSQRYEAAFAQSGRTISTDVCEATVLASQRWLDAALGNLLGNALTHGAGEVRVAARTRGHWLRLSVTDEGPGFPDAFVDKAFDRFARAEESRSTAGSGLGLSVVAAVARFHGGSVHIRRGGPGASVVVDMVCPPATSTESRLQRMPAP